MTIEADIYGDDDIPPDSLEALYGDDPDEPTTLDLRAAEWWARRIHDAERRIAVLEGRWLPLIRMMGERLDEATRPARDVKQRAVGNLERIHAELLKEDPTAKTIPLMHATLESRHYRETVKVQDSTALLAWLKDNRAEMVKTTEVPDWASLKRTVSVMDGKAFDPMAGEQLPGVVVEPEHTTFNVKTSPEPF